MAFKKRFTNTNKTTKKVTSKKGGPIYKAKDGSKYHSKAMRDYHEVLAADKNVKSFELATVENEEKMLNKRFGAFKVKINGITFDSVMESKFYVYLLGMKAKRKIKSFERQVTYELQPGFVDAEGKKILPIKYIADFVVVDKDGDRQVIDIKGVETAEFILKKKLFKYKHRRTIFKCLQWVAKKNTWVDLEEIKKERKAKKK